MLPLQTQMIIQTAMFEKWKKYQKSSIRARDCFQTASIICLSFLSSIFLKSTLKSLSRLHHLAWIPVVFNLSPPLLVLSCSIQQNHSLGWSSSPYSLFTQSTHFFLLQQFSASPQVILQKYNNQSSHCLKAFSAWVCAAARPGSPSLKCTGCGYELLSFTLSVCPYCSKVLYQWRCILHIIQCDKTDFSLFHTYHPPKTLK